MQKKGKDKKTREETGNGNQITALRFQTEDTSDTTSLPLAFSSGEFEDKSIQSVTISGHESSEIWAKNVLYYSETLWKLTSSQKTFLRAFEALVRPRSAQPIAMPSPILRVVDIIRVARSSSSIPILPTETSNSEKIFKEVNKWHSCRYC